MLNNKLAKQVFVELDGNTQYTVDLSNFKNISSCYVIFVAENMNDMLVIPNNYYSIDETASKLTVTYSQYGYKYAGILENFELPVFNWAELASLSELTYQQLNSLATTFYNYVNDSFNMFAKSNVLRMTNSLEEGKYVFPHLQVGETLVMGDDGLMPVALLEGGVGLENYQLKQDYGLDTYNKTIVEAINEILSKENYGSVGIINLPTMVRNTDGTVVISSDGKFIMADTSDILAKKHLIENPTGTTLTLVDNSVNFIYLDYNNGTPEYKVTQSNEIFKTDFTKVFVVRCLREGTKIHFMEYDGTAEFLLMKMLIKDIIVNGFKIVEGLTLSTETDRKLYVGSGKVMFGIKEYQMPQFESGTTDNLMFEYYYDNGVLVKNPVTTFDSTYYSDGTNRLTMTNNKYVCKYFYKDVGNDNEVYYMHGNQYTTIANALAEARPLAPNRISSHSVYIGKILIQKDSVLGTAYDDTGTTNVSNIAQNHNDLANRDSSDSHPISAITDLQTELNNAKKYALAMTIALG